MGRHTFRKLALVGAVGAVIAACGGGSTDLAEGGIGGTGISTGTVTGFGSVWVNGVEFETTQATIQKEGMSYEGPGMDRKYLRIGMVVTVQGDIDADGMRGIATEIEYSSLLRGRVDQTPANDNLVVLGQRVNVDTQTNYGGNCNSLDQIRMGDKVEVSGFYVHDNTTGDYIQGTYIECLSSISVYKITGVIERVENGEFYVRSLFGELEIQSPDAASLKVGDYVEAQLRMDDYDSRDEYVALDVSQRPMGLGEEDVDKAEMEGIVVGGCATLPCTFSLGLQEVKIDTTTSFSNGKGYTDIQSGVRLEVEGSVSNGVLIAREVEFED